jgi:hypothetical protein
MRGNASAVSIMWSHSCDKRAVCVSVLRLTLCTMRKLIRTHRKLRTPSVAAMTAAPRKDINEEP